MISHLLLCFGIKTQHLPLAVYRSHYCLGMRQVVPHLWEETPQANLYYLLNFVCLFTYFIRFFCVYIIATLEFNVTNIGLKSKLSEGPCLNGVFFFVIREAVLTGLWYGTGKDRHKNWMKRNWGIFRALVVDNILLPSSLNKHDERGRCP
jgi:hypothetical protein